MSNQVALVPVAEMEKMALAVARSGLFGISKAEEALSLMLIAQAEGRHPGIVARDYHIIKGKPSLKADTIMARFQEAGGKVKWTQLDDNRVSAIFSHPAGGEVEIDWDLERAKNADLGGRDMWKKFPRQMLRARVISEGVRTVFPAVLCGFYTPEEVQDFDTPKQENRPAPQPEPEQPKFYPEDQYRENFAKWAKLIREGKKTAEQIIRMVETKGLLTDQQKCEIAEITTIDAEVVQ